MNDRQLRFFEPKESSGQVMAASGLAMTNMMRSLGMRDSRPAPTQAAALPPTSIATISKVYTATWVS